MGHPVLAFYNEIRSKEKEKEKYSMTLKYHSVQKSFCLFLIGLQAICFTGCASKSGTFYTKIDADKAEAHDAGGSPIDLSGAGHAPYSYTLPCFDASADEQELTFGADEPFEDGIYLALDTQFIRGVIRYEIVEEADVPADALKAIQESEKEK